MANFCLNFLIELTSISFEFKRFCIYNSNYLTSVLDLIDIFKNEEIKLKKIFDLIQSLIDSFDDETKFESNIINYFFNLIKRFLEKIFKIKLLFILILLVLRFI